MTDHRSTSLVRRMLALPLVFGLGIGTAAADTIQIFNNSGPLGLVPGSRARAINITDLTFWSQPGRMGRRTPIIPPAAAVNLRFYGSASPVFGGPFTFIGSYAISETVMIGARAVVQETILTKVKKTEQLVIASLTDGLGDPLYLEVDESQYTLPPPEGTMLDFTNGTTPGEPDWTLYSYFDDFTGVLSGLYTGSAVVFSTGILNDVTVPEPASAGLLFVASAAAVGAGLIRRRTLPA